MPPTLLVERAFIDDFVATVRQARAHIEVQCMSFEGDQAGALVSRELIKKAAEGVRVRVLIDYFTDLMVSDRPASHSAVAREVQATRRMIRQMEAAGAGVRRTRPLGPLNIRCLIRNHKKLLVVEGRQRGSLRHHAHVCAAVPMRGREERIRAPDLRGREEPTAQSI